MGRTACTEPRCLYKGALYLYFLNSSRHIVHLMESEHSLPHSQVSATCPHPEPDNMNIKKVSMPQGPAKAIMTEYRRPKIVGDEGDWHSTARSHTHTYKHTHTDIHTHTHTNTHTHRHRHTHKQTQTHTHRHTHTDTHTYTDTHTHTYTHTHTRNNRERIVHSGAIINDGNIPTS